MPEAKPVRAPRSVFVTAKSVPVGDGWVHKVKFDGYRLRAHKVGSRVLIFSRNGHDFTLYPMFSLNRANAARASSPANAARSICWRSMAGSLGCSR
jgi:ATP-dependent DNA ligase